MNLDLDADLARYGLQVKPFQSSTDPTFLWLGRTPREILDRLKTGILDGEGVLLLTGAIGTGKSILAKALLESVGPEVVRAALMYARVALLDFLNEIGDAWGMGGRHATREAFYGRLTPFLADAAGQSRRLLLLIDEAQTLSGELFAEIGHLASIVDEASHGRPGLSIVLIGQEELNAILSKPENAALEKRVRVRCTTVPLRDDEVREYVAHRLQVAGADRPVFTADGLREIAAWSQGIPRLINMFAGAALVSGARQNVPTIDAAIVRLEPPLATVDRSGARRDGPGEGKESRMTPAAPGRRAGEAIHRLGRRRRPMARPEPAPDEEAGRSPLPAEASGPVPPVAEVPVPAEPGPVADTANRPHPVRGRDLGEADGSSGPAAPERGTAVDPVERAPAAGRIQPSGGEGKQGRYRLLSPPVEAPGGEVPRRLSRLVMRVLDRRATRRGPDLGALLNALRLELAWLVPQDVSSKGPRRWGIAAGIAVAAALGLAALMWWTAEVRRFRPVPEPSMAEWPVPLPSAPKPVTPPAEPQAPSAEAGQAVPREPIPVPPAVEPPSPPPRVSPVRAVAPPAPVVPQPARPSGSPDAARPAETAAPAESREPDPTAIIDWVLRNR